MSKTQCRWPNPSQADEHLWACMGFAIEARDNADERTPAEVEWARCFLHVGEVLMDIQRAHDEGYGDPLCLSESDVEAFADQGDVLDARHLTSEQITEAVRCRVAALPFTDYTPSVHAFYRRVLALMPQFAGTGLRLSDHPDLIKALLDEDDGSDLITGYREVVESTGIPDLAAAWLAGVVKDREMTRERHHEKV